MAHFGRISAVRAHRTVKYGSTYGPRSSSQIALMYVTSAPE